MGERYAEIARQYPKIGRTVSIYHPDMQGPMDICEVVWGGTIFYHKGAIMLRNDSAMNFSARMYQELIGPYDQRLLDEFGGGAIHFCGKGDHYIPAMSELRGLNAINLTQPELNDMEKVYRHTVDKGSKLLGLKREAADAALARGRDLRGQVHCP